MTLWGTVAPQAPLSMGILQAGILEWVAMPFSRDLPNPGIEPRSPYNSSIPWQVSLSCSSCQELSPQPLDGPLLFIGSPLRCHPFRAQLHLVGTPPASSCFLFSSLTITKTYLVYCLFTSSGLSPIKHINLWVGEGTSDYSLYVTSTQNNPQAKEPSANALQQMLK